MLTENAFSITDANCQGGQYGEEREESKISEATVNDLSNCDIAWFVVSFDESTDPATILVGKPEMQTLEHAVEGLTGGHPVTLSAFESKIVSKLSR